MKKILFTGLMMISFIACQDDKKTTSEERMNNNQEVEVEETDQRSFEQREENEMKEKDSSNYENKSTNNTDNTTVSWKGQFMKADASNNTNCNCNCLDIDFDVIKNLCIDEKSGISIQVEYRNTSNKIEMIYLNGKGNIEEKNPIPWSDFDKNSVVAEITPNGNQIQLDWKGFTINNELATDYAILGKKNLEGNYKRK